MAGLGETCSHVASMLWAIESGVRLRDSMTVTHEEGLLGNPKYYQRGPVCPKPIVIAIDQRKAIW